MFLVGKLVFRQEDVRSLPAGPSTSSPLIYLQDSLSSRRFLIDSGASVSVFSDPIALALKADEIYQSRVSSSADYMIFGTPEDVVNAVRSSPTNRPRRSATPHSSSRDTRSLSPSLCYYHRTWGTKAKKCRAPCSWSGN